MKEAAAHLTGGQGSKAWGAGGGVLRPATPCPSLTRPSPAQPPTQGLGCFFQRRNGGDGGVGGGRVDVKGATEGCVEIKVYSRHYGVQIVYAPQVELNAITRIMRKALRGRTFNPVMCCD